MDTKQIENAFDAFWFIYYHPELIYPILCLPSDDQDLKNKYEAVQLVKQEPWAEQRQYTAYDMRVKRHAIDNLDIFYAKVDSTRTVNDDPSKNIYVECWLEIGQVKDEIHNGELQLTFYHDAKLDSGGPTFDDALIVMANKLLRIYGNYDQEASANDPTQ